MSGTVNKPGVRTTEFWATLLTHVFTVAASAYALLGRPFPDRFAALQALIPVAGMVASAAVQVGYNASRGRVKAAVVQVLATWDDAEAVYDAIFPDSPTPASVTAAAAGRRRAAGEATTAGTSGLGVMRDG